MRRPDPSAHLLVWPGPFGLEQIHRALVGCTVFTAIETSDVVEPAASFMAYISGRARAIYVGPEEPANSAAFTETYLSKAGELLPFRMASC